MSLLLEMFTYPFILRAFVVGILVALCAALLGVPLVLKRYSMIGDGLSHVSFGALSHRTGLRLGAAAGVHPGGGAGGAGAAADDGEQPDGRGRRHRGGQRLGAGRGRGGHQSDHRHDHGCGQLYVRLHPGHGPGGCGAERGAVRGGAGAVSCCFTTGCSPSPSTRASPGPPG